MQKLKFRATIDFDLHLDDDAIFDKASLNTFGRWLVNMTREWEGFELIDGPYEDGENFANAYKVNCKVRRRTGK